MRYEHFIYQEHGFVGHLAAPDSVCDKAVIVMMGGEKSLLPGIKIAERFADYGITGPAVSLFGAAGLPDSPDRIPLEMFESALRCLADRGYSHISTYGMSMGSIFAALTAVYFGGVENVILVSPTHVPFEGTDKSKKHMSGHSVATFRGEDIPFVSADFSDGKAAKYQKAPAADYPVMGMWISYYNAYQDKVREQEAFLPLEKSNARILLIAGDKDEAWPSAYSVRKMEAYLTGVKYEKEVAAVIYKNVSHLTGMMPNREREKLLYRLLPFVGLMYKSFGKYQKECLAAIEDAEKTIIEWINYEES
ncbi:MAG: hypothetical protein LIP11_09230 [Clostridiales bacterium]|nr:hypothetical protein [Clostridiales bacterium]